MRTSVADLSAAEAPDAVAFSGAGSVMDLARNAGEYAAKTVANFRPVSTAELNQPDDGDWLNWRRTLDGHGHSPLTAINTCDGEQTRSAVGHGHAYRQQSADPARARWRDVPDALQQQNPGDRGGLLGS